jgi:hypothetical protein
VDDEVGFLNIARSGLLQCRIRLSIVAKHRSIIGERKACRFMLSSSGQNEQNDH